jgi:hypothetical protein
MLDIDVTPVSTACVARLYLFDPGTDLFGIILQLDLGVAIVASHRRIYHFEHAQSVDLHHTPMPS